MSRPIPSRSVYEQAIRRELISAPRLTRDRLAAAVAGVEQDLGRLNAGQRQSLLNQLSAELGVNVPAPRYGRLSAPAPQQRGDQHNPLTYVHPLTTVHGLARDAGISAHAAHVVLRALTRAGRLVRHSSTLYGIPR